MIGLDAGIFAGYLDDEVLTRKRGARPRPVRPAALPLLLQGALESRNVDPVAPFFRHEFSEIHREAEGVIQFEGIGP